MYAQCPQCLTFFHLKPSHLKAAQGRVRCSRCKHVFNALETLRDDLSPEEIAAAKAARRRDTPSAPNEEYAGDLFDGLDYTRNEELGLDRPTESAKDNPPPMAEDEVRTDELAAPARTIHDFGAPRRRRRHPFLLAAANIALLLALAAQLAHWQRERLLEHPVAGRHLARVYAALGVSLEPPRDLRALEVSRTDVGSHPDHPRALYLTAVLDNTGERAQPWPELRVDLQDRWGRTVGARYFTAAEYLRDPSAAQRPLAPRARAAIELAIVDPGSDAVGFRVEPCFADDASGERRYVCTAHLEADQ